MRKKLSVLVLAALLLSGGVWLGTALADRSSSAPPLVYSGQILSSGAPIADGAHLIGLSLWRTPSGATGGLCDMAPTSTPTTAGRFSIELSSDCGNVFETNDEVYVELEVDGTMIGRTTARVGAVPYAVRAEQSELAAASESIVRTVGTQSISFGGLYCGMTPTSTGIAPTVGGFSSYRGIRQACISACSSPTAHLCTVDELAASEEIGVSVPAMAGRITGMAGIPPVPIYSGGLSGTHVGFLVPGDCGGYTIAHGAYASPGWSGGSGAAHVACDGTAPFFCCD